MRKFHKQTLKELLETLKEANSELFKSENKPYIPALKSGINDFLTAITKFIESNVADTDENKTQVLKLIDNCSEKFAGEVENLDQKQLKQQIHGIEVAVQKFKVTQFEVVFVVDSKSKSDALLPIYEVALADPDCIAHWLPVPLYGLNSLRQKSEIKYDGQDKYPNIKCEDFRNFNLEKIHPDVIFTNNIYDDCNYVTQMFPEFHTKTLKKHTDFLVYVPYFVAGNVMTEKAFVALNGMVYPDLVVLENENIRKFYEDTAREFFDSSFNFNKFVALGSPKYDETLKYAKLAETGELEIPQDWKDKIYKTDGTKRKVVFYNTSIANLLQLKVPEMYCEKVESVLVAFKRRLEEKDDIVLLWRPHPLFFTTIKSMRPMLADRWLEIIESYKNDNYGIYDESGDMHRAVAVSDCYYGDASSLTKLFDILDKNIFLMTSYSQFGLNYLSFTEPNFQSFFKFKDDLYVKNADDCILKFNPETQVFDFFAEIPKSEESGSVSTHAHPLIYNDNTWFCPYNDNRLVKLSPEKKSLDFYKLDLQEKYIAKIGGKPMNFLYVIFYENRVFFFPSAYRAIVAYNFENGKTEHCLDLRKYFPKSKIDMLFQDYEFLNENTILFSSCYTNEILEFSLETYSHKIHKFGNNDRHFMAINKYGDDFFLVGRQPFVAKWNYKTKKITYYDNLPQGFKTLKPLNYTWYFTNYTKPYKNKLILLGGYTNMALEFNLDSCEYKKIDSINPEKETIHEENDAFAYSACSLQDNEKLYFVRQAEALCCYNMETGEFNEICEIKTDISEDVIEKLNDGFLDKIANGTLSNDTDKLESCSEKIHEYIKKVVNI